MKQFIKHGVILFFVVVLGAPCVLVAQEHPVKGIVLKVDAAHRSLIVSCDAIPDYMSAMEMSFVVNDSKILASLKPGKTIRFTMVEQKNILYAKDIHEDTSVPFEAEPMQAGGLSALHRILDPSAAAKIVPEGGRVPEFILTDQAKQQIRLSQFQGKVIALTFGYSRCPNPNYCLRLSNNLNTLQQRFQARMASDLVLLTIMLDPEHDKDAVLTHYAEVSKANSSTWHFLTGSLPDVQNVADMFGITSWKDEGSLTHPLHTVVIDRQGRLVANIEGNQFTAKQLGDLVETVIKRN